MVYVKRMLYTIWIVAILYFLIYFVFNPEMLTAQGIKAVLERLGSGLWISYALVVMLRGIFLIPGIPFAVAGSVIFSEVPLFVLIVVMTGTVIAATMIYHFSDSLGFSKKLMTRYPRQFDIWKQRLQRPYAILLVIGWSFFPLVPTNLISYVGGIVKIPLLFILIGIFIGELILNIGIIYFGRNLVQLF
jgi:uncharacterized membrane protein YdjX (TVP38/TMEM64 family)